MILDGAVDPNADPIQADIDQAEAFQKAFNDYAADCAKDPDCPLGTDPAKAVDVYRDLVDPLVDKPMKTKRPARPVLQRRDRRHHHGAVLAEPVAAPDPGLTEMTEGRGDTMLALADMYMRRDRAGALHQRHRRPRRDQLRRPAARSPTATKVVDEDRRLREVAPFMSYGEFTGHAPMSTCAFWPVPATSTPHTASAPGLPPVLVISTTGDPATPYQAGVDLAKQLGGALLTFNGTQHTVAVPG